VSAVAAFALTACGDGSTSETGPSDGAIMSEAGSLDAKSSPEGSASTDGASSPNDGAPTGADGASIDGGACTFPTTAPAPQCFAASTILPSSRTPIASLCASGDPPQPEGGVVPDGIYILTAREIYSSTCGSVPGYEIGIIMCSGRWLMTIIVANDAGPSNDSVIYDYSEVRQGDSFVLTQVCSTSDNADAGTTTVGYTYSSGQLTLDWTSSGQEIVETYVKE
jgi:hypothetical protein